MTNTQARTTIEKIEKSITEIETCIMTQEEFEEYCDAAYTLIAYLRILPKRKG